MNRHNPSRETGWLRAWGALAWLAILLAGPYFAFRILWSGKYRRGLRQRLTQYTVSEKERLSQPNAVWLHAVSVGELQAARPLLQQIKKEHPSLHLLVSTVTETGQALAQSCAEIDGAFYFPLDLPVLCRRALDLVQPRCVLMVETELWPNFIRAVSRRGVPLYLVNARISDRSYHRYRRLRPLFAPVLQRFEAILAQSPADLERFHELGMPAKRLVLGGNLKFDAAVPQLDPTCRDVWRTRFHVAPSEWLLVGGSTFPGEEKILAEIMLALRQNGVPLRLLVAPRHVDRVPALVQELRDAQVEVALRSQLSPDRESVPPARVLLLDTLGELRDVYAAADLVFMGKSLCAEGGQNPLEPAAWSRPIVFGPHMQNFRKIASLLLQREGAVMVHDAEELASTLRRLCMDAAWRAALGRNARHVVEENLGAVHRVLEVIAPALQAKETP